MPKLIPRPDNWNPLTVPLPAEAVQRLDDLRRGLGYETTVQVAQEAIEWYLRVRGVPEAETLAGLTPRLREVLQFIGEGHSSKQMAAQLGISVKTVEMHRTHLRKALGIRGVAGLVRYAIRSGLVRLDD